ncbi:MAG: TRAP transporter small permease [Deltaproteobacteria bacterium]|nr:TRAP transporter small permease [Deltaproteobacteria bacterium]
MTDRFNWIAAGAVVAMMCLTCADVILRIFRHPIPGTYEIVGLLGSVVIAFSIGYTSVEKGHIAVEFLVQKFPVRVQTFIDTFNDLISTCLFALITWQSIVYASDLKQSGEVSLTIQMPIYPFVYGISLGCGLLCLILLLNFVKSLKRIGEK